MRDSAGAKLAVVLGLGALAIGGAALRARVAAPPLRADRVAPVATLAASAVATARTTAVAPVEVTPLPAATAPRAPTLADRLALLEAATEGDLAKVEALAAKGVNLDGALGNAARSGSAPLVLWLLAHGVDVHEDEDLAVPPLLMADEHPGVVAALLAKGAREPSLAKAVAVEAPGAVTRLLAKGASATSRSAEGEPVVMLAIRDGAGARRRQVVDALLKAGADVSVKYDEETPLGLALASATSHASEPEAAGDRAVDLVGKLVARGARVDGEALVAALGASEELRGAILDALLAGALERTATLRAVGFAADHHDVAAIKRLAARGVAWSSLEAHASPPLATAIVASDVAVVRALLEAGAPTDRLGEDGDTALLAAVAAAAGESDDALRVVRVLLEHGASPNKRGRDGRTALFAAAQQGTEGLVALLVAKGARVDDAVDGMTPLEAADARGYDAVVKVLKARGAKWKAARLD
jgi:ankyrin repeat protein